MTFPVDRIRRACVEARNAPGMRVGLPRVTLDVSHVEALLDRLAGAERECNRLAADCLATGAVARRECAEFLCANIGQVVSAGMVVENSQVRQRLRRLADKMAAPGATMATPAAGPATPPAPAADDQFSPEWFDGLPHCDDRCAQHDGKRCRLLGFPPGRAVFCEPALDAMRDDRDALRAAIRAFLVANGATFDLSDGVTLDAEGRR